MDVIQPNFLRLHLQFRPSLFTYRRSEGLLLGQQIKEKMTNLELMEGKMEIEAVDEKIRKLGDERRLLVDGLEKGSQDIDRLTIRATAIDQRQDKLSEQRLQTQQRLDDLLHNELCCKRTPRVWVRGNHQATACDGSRFWLIANDSGTPQSWAAKNGYEAVIRLLLATSKVNAELKEAPLLYAAMNGHDAVVRQLLEAGAAVRLKDTSSLTPLSWAAINGHEAVLKLLLERGTELESQDTDGQTPLSWAAANAHETVVKLLLEKDAELESKDAYNHTPLLFADMDGHEAVAELLLEVGAAVGSKDTYGQTPLSWAAWNGHKVVVKQLL
jgi:ankyrin repeat protein